jgi:hypothetical protein
MWPLNSVLLAAFALLQYKCFLLRNVVFGLHLLRRCQHLTKQQVLAATCLHCTEPTIEMEEQRSKDPAVPQPVWQS